MTDVEETPDAVQVGSPEEDDVQQGPEDGEGVGEEDSEGEEAAPEGG